MNTNIENHIVLNTADAPWNQPDADEPTPVENAAQAEKERRDMAAAEYADGLRQIADFIEENPDFKLPGDLFMFFYGRQEFVNAVKILAHGGKVEKRADSGNSTLAAYHAIRNFGPVAIHMQIDRKTVCRLVTPAVYDCPDSLLEAAAEYAEA
jgi:hypothetical protein